MALISKGPTGRSLAIYHPNPLFPAILCLSIYLLNLGRPVSAVLTTCYDPSGDVRGDVPCNQEAEQSACCGQGWVCTNISLCVAGPTVQLNPGDPEQFEGSCTDRTWNSPFCPSFCRTGNLSLNAANGMWNCSNGNWCCSAFGGDTGCCKRNTDVFFLGDYENITTIGGAIGPGFSTTTTSQTSTSLTVSTTVSTTTPLSSSSSTATTTSLATPGSTDGSNLGIGAKVGIGIGVVVGAGALCALGFFFYRQRKITNKGKGTFRVFHSIKEQKDPRAELSALNTTKYTSVTPVYEMGMRDEVLEMPAEYERSSLR